MDPFIIEKDFKLLKPDKYTFFVLDRIMRGSPEVLISDHERLIICFSERPFPVWIWTPDDASEEEMERAYQLAGENGLVTGEHHFNMKYNLAEHFIRRAARDGLKMKLLVKMYAYDCPEPVRPEAEADGEIYRCEMRDVEELVSFLEMFHKEIGIDQKDAAGYRADAEAFIKAGTMYFWKDAQGRHVASCRYAPNGEMASVNLVYTRPEFRRRHYAENLVYQVTVRAQEAGYVPMLYTDADYAASNACYEKIGYVLRGRLCTIG